MCKEQKVIIPTNEYQTPITEELRESLPKEVWDQLYEAVTTIPFIQNLISPNRKRAKDLERDELGRIKVDLCNPHIIENMDYFREAALYYKENGCYTKLRPNANPNSEYGKWIRRERDRCWYGMVRPEDGEWISGDMYFYLNYSPIMVTKTSHGNTANRVEDFPSVWEGIYYRYHYMDQAKNGGIYNNFKGGNHGAELARRGAGKSYSIASKAAKNFILGQNKEACKRITTIMAAYQGEYISSKDGTVSKFTPIIDFCALHTGFPKRRLIDSTAKMVWQMGYQDKITGAKKGSLNLVLGVAVQEDEDKLRGKRGDIFLEEFGCHIKGTKVLMYNGSIKNVEDIVIGDVLMGNDNTPRIVQKLYNGIDQLYKITLSNGDYQIVNSHHPIYFKRYNWYKNIYTEHILTAPELLKIKNLNKGYYIPKAIISFPHIPVTINPYFLGLWLGDGDSSRLDIANEDKEVLDWLKSDYKGKIRDLKQSATCKVFHISKNESIYNKYFIDYNLYNNKHIPKDYKINTPEIQLQVIAGLIDTDGTYKSDKNYFEITQRYDRKHILDDIKFMCECNGLKCSLSTRVSNGKKEGILHYRLRISGDLSIIPTKISRKKGKKSILYKSKKCWNDYTFKVEPYKVGEYYGFTIDKNHLFVLGDLTVTHNTFPSLLGLYNTLRPSVEEGDKTFGLIYMIGTSGNKAADFLSAQEIIFNPDGYNIYSLPNVYDKGVVGKRISFFYGAYLNRAGCYNQDGVSDVVKALLQILLNRYKVKYNSSEPDTIIRTIAEMPITPQEAITRVSQNIFPVTLINDRLSEIDTDETILSDVLIGRFKAGKGDNVLFETTSDLPIREYPTKDNTLQGAVEIYKQPVIDPSTGRAYSNRYIASVDPIDDDGAKTMSFFSFFVLDCWTDEIVCEYTGRYPLAEDNYEVARLGTIYYNASLLYENNKKGIYAYFKTRHSTHYMSVTPEYLLEKELIKERGYGNKAYGVNATAGINSYGRALLRDWLLTTTTELQVVDGEEVEVTIPNVMKIKSRALLKELSLWNSEGNFDRVSSCIMLMIKRQEVMIKYGGNPERQDTGSDLADDDFFTKNYPNYQSE